MRGRRRCRLRRAAEAGHQRERVGHVARGLRVAGHSLQRGQQTGRGAAREAALHDQHARLHLGQRPPRTRQRQPLQRQHAQVEGYRVETARENDPRAAGTGRGVVAADHRGHPGRLAAEVQVVRGLGDASLQQRLAAELVGADGGDHGARALGQAPQRGRIAGIGLDQRVALGQAEFRRQRPQPRPAAAGQRPAQALAAAVPRHHFGRQPPREPRGPEDHEVKLAFAHPAPVPARWPAAARPAPARRPPGAARRRARPAPRCPPAPRSPAASP